MKANPKPQVIDSLTGMRFFAALLVFFFHFVRISWLPDCVNNIFAEGYRGVQFFFVLSGFILFYNYSGQEPLEGMALKHFWVARASRILPLYYLALILTLPLFIRYLHVELQLGWQDVAKQGGMIALLVLTLTQTFIPLIPIVHGWNAPAWSLSNEAVFYITFPWLLRSLSCFRLKGRGPLLVTLPIVGLFLLDWAVIPLLPLSGEWLGIHGPYGWDTHPVYGFFMFLSGMAWGRLFVENRGRLASREILIGGAEIIVLLALLTSTAFKFSEKLGKAGNAYTLLAFGVLIFLAAFNRGPLSRCLSHPLMILLGNASYALYLLQAPVRAYVQQFYSKILGFQDVTTLGFYALITSVGIMASVLTCEYFETPARRYFRALR